jgi:hypothetical protein
MNIYDSLEYYGKSNIFKGNSMNIHDFYEYFKRVSEKTATFTLVLSL